MRRIISLFLVVTLLCGLGLNVLAAWHLHNDFCSVCGGCLVADCTDWETCTCTPKDNDYTAGTIIEVVGTGTEGYTVTVPAHLTPETEGIVAVSGTWGTHRYLSVTTPEIVTLRNAHNTAETIDVVVEFKKIGLRGNDLMDVEKEAPIIVKLSQEVPLFGNWTGKIEYTVSIETRLTNLAGTAWQMNENIYDYEWMPQGDVDNTSDNSITLISGNLIVDRINNFQSQENMFSIWGYCPNNNMGINYAPQAVAESFGFQNYGWVSYDWTLGDAVFNDGDITEYSALIASVNFIEPPIATFANVDNNYFKSLQLIDWLYENAILLEG